MHAFDSGGGRGTAGRTGENDMPLTASSMQSLAAGLFIAGAILACLTLGKAIAIPIALATLLAFVLSPIVSWIGRHGVQRGIAAGVVVLTLVAGLATTSVVFSRQLLSLTADLGAYQENIVTKVRAVTGGAGDGVVSKAARSISRIEEGVRRELKGPDGAAPAQRGGSREDQTDRGETGGLWITEHLDSILTPIGQIGLTLLFTLFVLADWNDIRDKLVRFAGTDNITSTTAALSESSERLASLFLAQTMLNAGFGVVVSIALWLIGVPYALLWGATAFVMRFVPFIGSVIATIPPTLVALAVDPGWALGIATLSIFLIGEPLLGHVIEPLVLGKSAGLSPLAMVVAAAFWTLLWGPVGLVLAAPLTLVLVVIGQFVPRLEFISVMLSNAPALTPEHELYHRLLTADTVAAVSQAEEQRDDARPVELADSVILPALELAARDHRLGMLDAEQIGIIDAGVAAILEARVGGAGSPAGIHAAGATGQAVEHPDVIVIPARGEIDAIASGVIAAYINHACGARAIAVRHSSGLMGLASLEGRNIEEIRTVIVATAGGIDTRHLKYLVARAEKAFPQARALVYRPPALRGLAGPEAPALSLAGITAQVSVNENIARGTVHADRRPQARTAENAA